jgi:hypothetical protein
MTADSAKVMPPTPKYTRLPPEPHPRDLEGRTLVIRFRVNEKGQPDLAATVITGPIRSPYLERFIESLRGWTFRPALLEGCAVPGSTEIKFTLFIRP